MKITAKLNYLRIASRKVRLVADLIRAKKVEEAQDILNFATKKAAEPLFKLLNSAVANARNNFQIEPNNLYIKEITVDEGPKYKRWMPRARGQAYEIQKKTSHITLVLEERVSGAKKKKAIKKVAKKVVSKERKEEPEAKKEAPKKEIFKKEKPKLEVKLAKPLITRGIKRIFRRKAF